jgi:hypothetical protein
MTGRSISRQARRANKAVAAGPFSGTGGFFYFRDA